MSSQANFDRGQLNGTWTIYDSKQRKISEWAYADGSRHGRWTSWYANGRKMRELSYKNGEIEGQVTAWDIEGQVASPRKRTKKVAGLIEKSTIMVAIKRNRKGTYLFAKRELKGSDDWWNAKLVEVVTVGKDERHGVYREWHANGQLRSEGKFDHGASVDKFTWWHPNGQKAVEGSFSDGQKSGRWIWWHASGAKSIQGGFASGGPSGKWIWWNNAGKVAQRVEYAAGSSPMSVAEDSSAEEKTSRSESESKPIVKSATAPQQIKLR